jgi:hypothetical protein
MADDHAASDRKHMRATLVRFGDAQYEELRAEAALAGVSIAEFVRQAVVAWITHNALLRSHGAEASASTNGHRAQRVSAPADRR